MDSPKLKSMFELNPSTDMFSSSCVSILQPETFDKSMRVPFRAAGILLFDKDESDVYLYLIDENGKLGDPGGKIKERDAGLPLLTALREFEEETNVSLNARELDICNILHLDFETKRRIDGYNYILFIAHAPKELSIGKRLCKIPFSQLASREITRRFSRFFRRATRKLFYVPSV